MLDRLFDFISSFLYLFKFWLVIDEYERAIILRLGKKHRELHAGFHWLLPFKLEVAARDNVVPIATRLKEQSLTTNDGKDVVLTPIVEWRIVEISLACLEVEDLDKSLDAAASGVVGDAVSSWDWADIQTGDFIEYVTDQIREKAITWGVYIVSVTFADCCPARSYRLWTST